MPTLEEFLRNAEVACRNAQRRVSDADERFRDLRAQRDEIVQRDGHSSMPKYLVDEIHGALQEQRAAKDALESRKATLEEARKIQDEEDEYQRKSREVYETDAAGRRFGPGGDDDHPRALTRKQSMRSWAEREGLLGGPAGSLVEQRLSFDKIIRGIATGDWRGAELEQRALTESPLTAGGHMVPTPVSLEVIDLARNKARTMQAGVRTVPMTSQTLKFPRLTAEASPAWRNEGASITDQAMTFDSVTLTAKSMAMLVKCSFELFEDAEQVGGVIEESFAAQIALELDRVILRGSGTSPEPKGVLNQTGVTLTDHGANGAVIGTGVSDVNYDTLVDAQATVRAANFEPNAVIDAPRTEQGLAKLKDTTGQYVQPPPGLLPRLATKQVPINLTVGTSADTSEIYTGQWDQCLLGLRTDLTIRFLQERFADNGEFAFLAYLRADVQLAHGAAFVVDRGVRS